MKNRKRILKRITAIALAIMMVGTTVDVSALTAFAAEDVAEVTCNHVCDETCGGMQAVTGSALSVCTHVHDEECGYEEAEAECTCETDDPAFHATNCPAYIAPENPQCFCAEKCTEDTLNIWCDVCGVQGVSACQGEDTAVVYTDVVASITNGETVTNYATFDEALANWTDGTTLTLLADVTLTERIKTYAKGLSLDLNGHKIECSDTLCTIWIDGASGSELTIRDSQDGGHINGVVYAVVGESKLCLESGTVETVDAQGDFTMTGGQIISEDDSGLYVQSEGDVVISGGEIYGREYGVRILNGNVIISDDTKITGADQYAIRSNTSTEVVISGTPTISGGAGEFWLYEQITLNTQPANGEVWRVKINTEEITDGIFAVPGEGIALDASKFASAMDGYEVKQNAKGELLLCNHTEQTAASNGDGTHNTTCNCGEETFDTNVACSGGVATDTHQAYCEYCNAPYGELNPDVHCDIIALTMTTEELEDALLELLNSGETDISILLASKADEEMFTAINTALCSSTAAEGSVNLTIAGVQVVTTHALGNGDLDLERNTDPVALKTLNFPDAVTLEFEALVLPNVQAVYLPKVTKWEIWGIWSEHNISTLVLTAPGSITANFDSLRTSDIDLTLHCNKKNDVTDGTTWQGVTWKSISFDHKDSAHTTATNNGNGTHSFTCTVCNAVAIQECTDEYSVVENKITKKCTACGEKGYIIITAEGGIYDGTTAYGATVIKTGIFENEEVAVDYYQGDTLIGTDAPVNAGTYTAKITYEEVTASVTYTINTTPTADMFTYIESAVYDGTAKSANVVVKDGITGVGEIANIKYYQNDIEVTPVNAGTYTVKIDVAKGDLFDAATDIEVGTFEITKATPTLDMFTATPSSELVYDGTEKSIIVTTDKVGMGTFTVSYISVTDSTQPVEPVEAGLYIVLLHIEEGDNYIADDTLSFVPFEIRKADSVITAAPTPADLVYDGTAQNLINAGTATGGEMQYSLDGTNYSSAIPTGTDAGEYTVWYKVVGDKNHNDTEPASIEVLIAKGTPDIGTVSASNLVNTLDVSEVVLSRSNETVPGTLSLAEGTILQYGIHDYTYVFTPNDNTNYETVTGTVSITISDTNAPTATYKVGTDGWKQFLNTITFGHFCKDYTTVDITYSDEESGVADKQYYISDVEITNTENIQWSEYTDTLNINATGKYYIYVRVTDNYGNVVIQNSEGIVVYAESVITPTSFSCEYGEENALDVNISTNGNTFANLTDGSGNEIATENYSIDGSTLTIKGEYLSDLDVGEYTYKICMNPLGVENTEVTLAYSFVVKVTAKELTVTGATATSRDYIANDITVDITGVTLSGKQGTDDVSVEITELKGTLSSANAGTYTSVTLPTLTLTGDDAENYVLVQPTSAVATDVTINKATPPALTIPTATTITYGEKLSASTLSDSSWAWVDGTIVPNASDYYNAYIEVDDSNYDYTGVYGYDDVNHRVVRGVGVIISRATLTITANSYTIKVGEALPTYEYTVTGLVGDDTLPVDVTVSCSATDSNTEDTYSITISGVVSDNILASHYAINYVDGTLTISEKDTQEITADDITLTYGETGKKISATTNGDGAITYTVATGTDVISVAADGTITVLKAGTATVTIRAAETADYAEATKTISVTVNKKKIAVPAVDTNGYIYTGTAQTYGVTSTDDYTVEGGVQTNAGEYPVTITLNNENYEWDGTLGTYEFVINKVAITVTAKNYSIKVSETLPTYAYEVAGLVNGETLPIDVAISCNATNSNTAGTYTITVSGAANSANYLFTYVNGTLIVSNKEEQTITASDVTLTYGETGKKISATTNGDGAITYTVATGTDVISVAADGTITVLKEGTATVTIRAAETADYAEAIKTISVTVSACSHRYTSKVTKQPSYTEKGERTYTCNCGHSYTEELPKLQPSSGGNNGGGGGTSGSGTPEPTATPIPTATPKPTVTPKPTPAPEKLPHIQDEDGKSGWDVIGDEIEKVIEDAKDSEEKAVVTVDMNGATKVPKDIFEQIAGKDVSVEFILDNGLKWTVNGKSVKADEWKDIDFAATFGTDENPLNSIPVKVINLVTGERSSVALQLAHSGEFGFEAVLTVNLEEKNAGLYANLFFYNEDAEELEFICADVIAKDGMADLTFTHASDYLIVLSETSMEPKEEGKEPEVKEPVLMKGYTVQIGAFSSEANAKKWEQKGEAINIPMFIIKDGKLFKVQTDVFETGEEAAEASKKLAAAGLTNFILKTERLVTPEGEETPEVPTKPTKPETPALPENPEKKSIEDLAKEVIAGKWGNGTDRKDRLTKAGYDYKEVQNKVNELLQ